MAISSLTYLTRIALWIVLIMYVNPTLSGCTVQVWQLRKVCGFLHAIEVRQYPASTNCVHYNIFMPNGPSLFLPTSWLTHLAVYSTGKSPDWQERSSLLYRQCCVCKKVTRLTASHQSQDILFLVHLGALLQVRAGDPAHLLLELDHPPSCTETERGQEKLKQGQYKSTPTPTHPHPHKENLQLNLQ